MNSRFDRRVVPEPLLEVVRACQEHTPAHLGGGAALSGAFLGHRQTHDLDVFVHDAAAHRELVAALTDVARKAHATIEVVRDGGSFVRSQIRIPGSSDVTELDLVHEPQRDLSPAEGPIEGIFVESLADLRASKITCLLSRAEPRDLVDLLFLERAGFRVEDDLPLALEKDAGIDPGILAWLLESFPCRPLPLMLEPLTVDELGAFRADLQKRLKAMSIP